MSEQKGPRGGNHAGENEVSTTPHYTPPSFELQRLATGGFWCAWCATWHGWADVAAYDGCRRICPDCCDMLAAIFNAPPVKGGAR
jgi:hypothetical protein